MLISTLSTDERSKSHLGELRIHIMVGDGPEAGNQGQGPVEELLVAVLALQDHPNRVNLPRYLRYILPEPQVIVFDVLR